MMRYFTLILLLYSFSACVSMPEKRRYFWPPLPDTPRIEFLGSYQTEIDFPKLSKWEVFAARFFGEEEAKRPFIKPWGIASNGKGKVYITDAPQSAIVIFDMANREVDIVKKVEYPYGIAIDNEGFLYVSSRKYHAVMVFDGEGTPLKSFGENELSGPAGIAINDELGLLYCVDTLAHDVKVFNLDGTYRYTIGKRGNEDGTFNFPTDVDVGSKGQVVVADSLNARIQVFDKAGDFVRTFGERGMGTSGFQMIKGISIDSEDHIYVTDALGGHFKVFSMEGDLLLLVGAPAGSGVPGGFNLPTDIDIDENDRIYIVDQLNVSFQVYQYMNKKYLELNPLL